MTLRLRINLIVGTLTVLFTIGIMALQFRNMRDSVNEEVVAANRVAAQLLNRTVWRYAAQGTPTLMAFLQSLGRVRSNDITLFDAKGEALYNTVLSLARNRHPLVASGSFGADMQLHLVNNGPVTIPITLR